MESNKLSPTPSGRLLSELEINKQLRKLYPSVEIMTFASRVAQVQQSLDNEEHNKELSHIQGLIDKWASFKADTTATNILMEIQDYLQRKA